MNEWKLKGGEDGGGDGGTDRWKIASHLFSAMTSLVCHWSTRSHLTSLVLGWVVYFCVAARPPTHDVTVALAPFSAPLQRKCPEIAKG
ncbi:hypothetical protein M5D96_004350 [Drosophila gunungcola]|uniref:Uncharacterized protein n=1 Tax=Drosophila gunungcola TaxID=103775 RepID=A0A9Q0BT77_9MUSC|nr:hypothetical protein M5D96_004350 [Drosophila gunungcola]